MNWKPFSRLREKGSDCSSSPQQSGLARPGRYRFACLCGYPDNDVRRALPQTAPPKTCPAPPDVIDEAIAGAVRAAERMARLASFEKQDVLNHCVGRFRERFDELAYALCVEAGKPIADSEGEVTRLIDTFRIAAEEAVRNYGEMQPLDISARAKGYMGMWKRVPIGACSFIQPLNLPFNLAAHT